MPQSQSIELDRALGVAGRLAEISELGDFPMRATALLRQLIPCDHAGYNAIDVPSSTATVVADPFDVVFEGGPEVLAQFAEQSPVIVRALGGDTEALRLSDHITQRELHRTDLYNHVYRRVGVEYQLVMQLPPLRRELGRPQELVGVSLCRSTRDFSDDDKRLLRLIRPILASTLERLHEVAFLRAIADGGGGAHGVVLVDGHNVVAWASVAALGALDLVVGAALPEQLGSWLASERLGDGGGSELRLFDARGCPLRIRLVRNAYPGLDAVHLTPTGPPSDPSVLHQRLGLTRRQAEVLALALEGSDTPRIARRLGISPRTVEKHFETIYLRLGVRTRSQAILAVIEDLAD